jgi:glycosyltransferase involved in cell wall biosynthesis
LKIIEQISGDIQLSVYGPEKDLRYAEKCKAYVSSSSNLKNRVSFHNAILKTDFLNIANDFDYFVLPTCGENFGHAIVESMAMGLPVIISDQTPWKFDSLDGNYCLSLDNPESWIHCLQELLKMDVVDHFNAKRKAFEFFNSQIALNNKSNISKYKLLLNASFS